MLAMLKFWSFRLATITVTLALLTVGLAWTHPFPLVSDGQGGYSDSRNFYAETAALGFSLLAVSFSLVSARRRMLLVLGSIGLFFTSEKSAMASF